MASQTTDIITIILAFLSLGLSIAGVIIAYHSLKALSTNILNTSTILPVHQIPRRPYHPYATGYIHYLHDPYLRRVVQTAYRSRQRILEVDGSDESVDGAIMELTPVRRGGRVISDTSNEDDGMS
ncbi:hypothetical protein ONS95_007266 [Cadophora gregata]|uniref:uncharacterized protein n=1 Tax=Cadophora gregata TaxID=51156 RepID=UPI0026DD4E66|nr:uncharacterized protein ONS95_007266 [Cadophora gregata]KAK0100818.1 hypothetical protein ONS95_007266 [Cadophora gregata]KAK0117188.1 hypothetical protein ONS96_013021 [Cadophora gregata f. sp. sojae]